MDHWCPFRIVRAFSDTGTPLAIGLEMITADNRKFIDRWVVRNFDEQDFISFRRRNWDMPWAFCRDIILYDRWQGVPLLGLKGCRGKLSIRSLRKDLRP